MQCTHACAQNHTHTHTHTHTHEHTHHTYTSILVHTYTLTDLLSLAVIGNVAVHYSGQILHSAYISQEFWDDLRCLVLENYKHGNFMICGDFNAHFGSLSDCPDNSSIPNRKPLDHTTNSFGRLSVDFLQICVHWMVDLIPLHISLYQGTCGRWLLPGTFATYLCLFWVSCSWHTWICTQQKYCCGL